MPFKRIKPRVVGEAARKKLRTEDDAPVTILEETQDNEGLLGTEIDGGADDLDAPWVPDDMIDPALLDGSADLAASLSAQDSVVGKSAADKVDLEEGSTPEEPSEIGIPSVRWSVRRQQDQASDDAVLWKECVSVIGSLASIKTEKSDFWPIESVLKYKEPAEDEVYDAPFSFKARMYQWKYHVHVSVKPELEACNSDPTPEEEEKLICDDNVPVSEDQKWVLVWEAREKRNGLREVWKRLEGVEEESYERNVDAVEWGEGHIDDMARVAAEINAARGY